MRLDRAEVVRIEFETNRSSGGNFSNTDGRPSGMRERQVIVSANVPWVDTGVDVRAGQTVYFRPPARRAGAAIAATGLRVSATRHPTRAARCRTATPPR